MANFKQLAGPCQDEVSRGVRLALWGFRLGAPLTQACDSDVQVGRGWQYNEEEEAVSLLGAFNCCAETAGPGALLGNRGRCLTGWTTERMQCVHARELQ